MKLKLSTIINSREALQEVLKKELPIKISFRIQKNLRLIEPEFIQYEEFRSKLIKEKYGEESGEEGNWVVKPVTMRGFIKELDELTSEEIELDIIKVTLPDDFKITPTNAYLLEWMLDFEDKE
jgi:hypothetical protein